jgi:hypothetical protein
VRHWSCAKREPTTTTKKTQRLPINHEATRCDGHCYVNMGGAHICLCVCVCVEYADAVWCSEVPLSFSHSTFLYIDPLVCIFFFLHSSSVSLSSLFSCSRQPPLSSVNLCCGGVCCCSSPSHSAYYYYCSYCCWSECADCSVSFYLSPIPLSASPLLLSLLCAAAR